MVIRPHRAQGPTVDSNGLPVPELPIPDLPVPQLYIGRLVHSKSLNRLEILRRAAVGVLPNGNIAFVRTYNGANEVDALRREFAEIGFLTAPVYYLKASQFFFPGMIDTHLHAPQWPNLALGMEGTLREWCETWTDPIEASYSDASKARRVYTDVARTTLKLGSTTVAYNSSIHTEATNILAESCFNAGQRAIVGRMSITTGSTHGNWDESRDASLQGSESSVLFIKRLDPQGQLVRPCIQPRGGPYCPPALMAGLGRLVKKHDTYVQGHMCETHSDIGQWTPQPCALPVVSADNSAERTLELHQDFECYSDMYKANGLLTSKSILAHCIHLTPKDFDNLKATNAGVAHNPNSNTCLRDGECRVRDLLDRGIKVGLGTDCSAGYMPSIHDAMRSASNVSRHLALKSGEERYILGFSEIVYLATMGGAQVVDMADKIGNFDIGKQFDALIVDVDGVISADPSLWETSEPGNDEAMVKKWVFLGDDRTIRKVFVGGKLVAGQDVN